MPNQLRKLRSFKRKLIERLDIHEHGWLIDEINSGAFDTDNHLRAALERIKGYAQSAKGDTLQDGPWHDLIIAACEDSIALYGASGNNDRITIRPEVQWFAEQMELTLRRNDHKGGWNDCSLQYLFEKLDEEVGELSATLSDEETIREASDVANIAMMIADNARREGGNEG